MNKNIGKYSNSVEFETEVYPGVYWVPINILGKSRYTNDEMKEISELPMERKKEKISNLYEAVQLFQISGFKGSLDNENHWVTDNELWQTHKTQEDAVFSNEGCCATDTNWLAYFIKDKYDFVGSFCYANTDGNGHITTYIQQDKYYYFLDMMMCRKDSQEFLCQEDGVLSGLLNSEWAGFLYKCEKPLDFCRFNISRFKSQKRNIPYCFYMRKTNCVAATGVRFEKEKVTFLIPQDEEPAILYLDETGESNILFVASPLQD